MEVPIACTDFQHSPSSILPNPLVRRRASCPRGGYTGKRARSDQYLEYKEEFRKRVNDDTVLPKFDRLVDRTNGLVITVHYTWSTHITLESLQVEGDMFRTKVHYRVQDHFGLDNDDDLTNPLYREFRIFRLWFVLQCWDEYGYKLFITEINATVEISGRRGE